MVQGDKYSILIGVKFGNTTITDQNIEDIRIRIGNITKGMTELTYNTESQKWLFPLSQAETLALPESTQAAVQIKKTGGIYTSEIKTLNIKSGLIREEWTNV